MMVLEESLGVISLQQIWGNVLTNATKHDIQNETFFMFHHDGEYVSLDLFYFINLTRSC